MDKIVKYEGRAPKAGGNGVIQYVLYVDMKGLLYVQFTDNEAEFREPGTFPKLAFPVRFYMDNPPSPSAEMEGVVVDTGDRQITKDRNASAFLRAVLEDLFFENVDSLG